MSTQDLQALSTAADAFAGALKTYITGATDTSSTDTGAPAVSPPPSPPPVQAYVPPAIGATQVIAPDKQITITVDPNAPPTMFTWSVMPWIWSAISGFRLGVDGLDLTGLIPGYTGKDPVADGYLLIGPSNDKTGTSITADPDGPGGNWGTPVVVLNGILAWNVTGDMLFNRNLPPAKPPLDMTKLTLVPAASDEFDGTDVDWTKWKTIWNYSDPAGAGCNLPSNGEQEWYINKDYTPLQSLKPWYVKDGQLHLVADKLPDALKQYCGYPNDKNYPPGTYNYYAGMIQNSPACAQTYGYFEVQCVMPSGQGLWPAFWLLPNDGTWPPELDVFEQLGQDPSVFYFTKHWLDSSGQGQSQGQAIHVDTTKPHKYGLWWDKDYVVCYLDGQEQVRYPNTNFNKPMYVVLNLAVGGNWGGAPDASTVFPSELIFDYLRVYTINS